MIGEKAADLILETTPTAAEGLVADAVRRELAPITERLTALERHVGVGRA